MGFITENWYYLTSKLTVLDVANTAAVLNLNLLMHVETNFLV